MKTMVIKHYKVLTFGETKRLIGLDEVLCDRLLFQEKLYVFGDDGKRLGRFSLNIDHEDYEKEKCKVFLVHISNKANLNGVQSETTATGTVSRNLKTLEEIRYEFSDVALSGKQERWMYLLRETTNYYCSVTSSVCGLEMKQHRMIPFVKSIGLMGEASNAVLMRAIAIRGFEGILCLNSILSNGKRCKNYYVSKLSKQIVNGKRIEVMIIYRNITNHKKYNLTMSTALTRAGQMIYLFWSNTKYFLHVDPELEIYDKMVLEGKEVGLERYWHRDMQLHSLYLDKKTENMALYRAMKYDKQAVKRIVRDFIQNVLLMRPNDIICFAIQYFTAFGQKTFRECSPKDRKNGKQKEGENEGHSEKLNE